jgi:hypothetical protein
MMMLHLSGVPGKRAVLGPADWYRIEERRLMAGPGNTVLATHEGNFWRVGDAVYTALSCPGPLTCHFEGGRQRRDDVEGPYALTMLIDGTLWGDELSIARYHDDQRCWLLLHTGQYYRSIALRLVTHPPPSRRP